MRQLALLSIVLLVAAPPLAHGERPVAESRFADFDDVKVHYETAGEGTRAIVFVHGWTCSAEFWKYSLSAFPEYRVVAVDLPGHGRSDKPRVRYGIDYFARSVEAVMRDAKLGRAVLVGHSMGASVVRQFYRLHPDQTLGLVFVDGLPWIESVTPENERATEELAATFRANYRATVTVQIDEMLRPLRDERLKREVRSAMLATPDHVGLSAAEGMMEFMGNERLRAQSIDVPLSVILSESGPWKPSTEAFVRAVAPALDFHVWRGVGHFLMLERPAAFNEAVRGFVSGNTLL